MSAQYAYHRHVSKRRQAARAAAIDRQVQFAWEHREHFATVKLHNINVSTARKCGDPTGSFRNAWEELGWKEAA